MISAMVKEIGLRKEMLKGQTVGTIYFGGGTPSLLSQQQLERLLDAARNAFSCAKEIECTLEANPDDIDAEKVAAWQSAGINRLSIGIQSFDEADLQWMNRAHTAAQALSCVHIAQAGGIDNISIDLMYGLPDMDNERWLKQVRQAISLGVTHVSAYCLTVEEKTLLHKLVRQNKIVPAGNEQQGEQFELLVSELEKAGILQYEISNFAREGYLSKHNSNYWRGVHYLGIGPSAHSFDGKARSWNIAHNRDYIRLVNENGAWYETETLSAGDQFNELLLTGLRTVWGVSLLQLERLLPLSDAFRRSVEDYISRGWAFYQEDRLILTPEGRLWADAIAQELFD